MNRSLRTTLFSGGFVFVAGGALWPPRAVYWTALAALIGEPSTLAVVAVVAVSLGAAFARVTGVDVWAFAGGGIAAYAVGMALTKALLAPASPVHLVLYGGLLGSFVLGVGLERRRTDRWR